MSAVKTAEVNTQSPPSGCNSTFAHRDVLLKHLQTRGIAQGHLNSSCPVIRLMILNKNVSYSELIPYHVLSVYPVADMLCLLCVRASLFTKRHKILLSWQLVPRLSNGHIYLSAGKQTKKKKLVFSKSFLLTLILFSCGTFLVLRSVIYMNVHITHVLKIATV